MPVKDLAQYKDSVNYASINGHQLAYWHSQCATEEAATIVFIHGFPSASWDWHHQWQTLKQNYNLIAMDMLGFGLSDKPFPHHYSLREQTNLLNRLLSHLGVETCHVIAHDYGDSVAQELLCDFEQHKLPVTLQSICFLNGGLFAESHRPLLTQTLLKSPLGAILWRFLGKAKLAKSLNTIFSDNTPPSELEVEAIWQLLEHNQGRQALPALLSYLDERKVRRDSWIKAMQRTDVPLYFINGVEDPISGQHMLERFRDLLPASKTTALAVGHYPQLEAPREVTQCICSFLSEVEAN